MVGAKAKGPVARHSKAPTLNEADNNSAAPEVPSTPLPCGASLEMPSTPPPAGASMRTGSYSEPDYHPLPTLVQQYSVPATYTGACMEPKLGRRENDEDYRRDRYEVGGATPPWPPQASCPFQTGPLTWNARQQVVEPMTNTLPGTMT